MDTEKKSTSSLFLLRHARKDPKNRLLAELLADFPTAEQIARLTEALRNSWDPDEEWGKNALAFLQVLKELFGADEPSYRAHLRNLYGAIEDKAMSYYTSEVPACTFELGIVDEVLQGWQPGSEDSHESFQFVCQAYEGLFPDRLKKGLNRKLCQGILDFLRRHMDKRVWESQDLDSWILGDVPDDVADLLLHAQIRLGGVAKARQRLSHMPKTSS